MAYETMSRRVAIMQAACEEFGMKFVLETAPDPTSDVGVAGAQAYILEKVPEWVEKYGENAAYFCTNDAHTEPLLKPVSYTHLDVYKRQRWFDIYFLFCLI